MGILAKIEEMREKRFEKKLIKIEKKNSSFLALRRDSLCSLSKGVMFPSVRFNKFIEELTRMQEEQPKIKTPVERVAEYIEKYKGTELRNCPFCNGSASLSIYLDNYDFHSGFPGGYDIFARIHCKKCFCGLDKIKLDTNIHPTKQNVDELIKDYAQKWNTRYSDSSCECRAPGELFYKSSMKFKDGKFCANNTEITKLPVQEFGQVIIADKLTDKQREEIKKESEFQKKLEEIHPHGIICCDKQRPDDYRKDKPNE